MHFVNNFNLQAFQLIVLASFCLAYCWLLLNQSVSVVAVSQVQCEQA